jgi:hypothetical protein
MCVFPPLSDEPPIENLAGEGAVNNNTPQAMLGALLGCPKLVPRQQQYNPSAVSSTPDNASASSVSVVPHSLLKFLGDTEDGSRIIASNVSLSELCRILRAEGESSKGDKGVSSVMMVIF